MSIRTNIERIKEEIDLACTKAGRDPREVKLIAVSKFFPKHVINEAYEAGQRVFGENKVQELVEKKPLLPDNIEWHLIGTLQKNKVKQVVDKVALIHSINSYELILEISKRAVQVNQIVKILLQVNIAKEESKFGWDEVELLKVIKEFGNLPGIKIMGLMTMAPLVANKEEVRPVFRQLRELAHTIRKMEIAGIEMKELSMGMSGDFQVAIEEGATLVRIGSRVFGSRNY